MCHVVYYCYCVCNEDLHRNGDDGNLRVRVYVLRGYHGNGMKNPRTPVGMEVICYRNTHRITFSIVRHYSFRRTVMSGVNLRPLLDLLVLSLILVVQLPC